MCVVIQGCHFGGNDVKRRVFTLKTRLARMPEINYINVYDTI